MPSSNTPDCQGTVTVCSACLCASCWHGIFYCDDYRTAGTVEKTPTELEALNREHHDYWRPHVR